MCNTICSPLHVNTQEFQRITCNHCRCSGLLCMCAKECCSPLTSTGTLQGGTTWAFDTSRKLRMAFTNAHTCKARSENRAGLSCFLCVGVLGNQQCSCMRTMTWRHERLQFCSMARPSAQTKAGFSPIVANAVPHLQVLAEECTISRWSECNTECCRAMCFDFRCLREHL